MCSICADDSVHSRSRLMASCYDIVQASIDICSVGMQILSSCERHTALLHSEIRWEVSVEAMSFVGSNFSVRFLCERSVVEVSS